MAKYVEDVESIRAALEVERMHRVAHSAATLSTFEYLEAYAERVGALVLIGALPHKNGRRY